MASGTQSVGRQENTSFPFSELLEGSYENEEVFTVSVFVVIGLFFSGLALSQGRPALADEMGYADTILIDGKIVSMNDRSNIPDTPGHIYQAMAIKGKKSWF